MIYKKVHLKKYYPKLKYNPILEIMSPEVSLLPDSLTPIRPLMLVIGGGGYQYVSQREMDPVCIAYMKEGFVAASLKYTTKPDIKSGEMLYPHPMYETIAAIDYLRKHVKEYRFNPNKVSLVGFSAGGHLVASIGAFSDKFAKELKLNPKDVKPNSLVLAYSVIEFTYHSGTRESLINNDKSLFDTLSIEKHINKNYPPTFIWCTEDDQVVPSRNTKNMVKALKKAGVKYKSKIYPHGLHGLSTLDVTTNGLYPAKEIELAKDVKDWLNMSVEFLKEIYKNVKD